MEQHLGYFIKKVTTMIFDNDAKFDVLKLLWKEDNYAATDTKPYCVANLVVAKYELEGVETFEEGTIFENFLAFSGLQMCNPFLTDFNHKSINRETALYEIGWHLQHGQCCEIAVFENDSFRSNEFVNELDKIVEEVAFFYKVQNPNIATFSYTNQSCIVWIGNETIGTLFFLGYD